MPSLKARIFACLPDDFGRSLARLCHRYGAARNAARLGNGRADGF